MKLCIVHFELRIVYYTFKSFTPRKIIILPILNCALCIIHLRQMGRRGRRPLQQILCVNNHQCIITNHSSKDNTYQLHKPQRDPH